MQRGVVRVRDEGDGSGAVDDDHATVRRRAERRRVRQGWGREGEDRRERAGDQWEGEGARHGRAVHKVKAAAVEVIDMSRPLKVGDACLAVQMGDIQPCKVTKAVDGGLAYAVTFADGSASRGELGLDEVAPAPATR